MSREGFILKNIMKNLLLLSISILFSLNIFANEVIHKTTPAQTQDCIETGNVRVELTEYKSHGYCVVSAANYNDVPVNVSYTVKAYDTNGKEYTVATGTIFVSGKDDKGQPGVKYSTEIYMKEGLHSYHLSNAKKEVCN